MKLPKIGPDPMDVYSSPISQIKTKLAIIFEIKPRQVPEKPGRSLSVIWDKRIPFIKGFQNNYDYIVSFEKLGEKAGNHYHHSKQELFVPIIGQFKIILEDINTKIREEIFLSSSDHQILYVPPQIAHVVIAESEISSLLVLATFPNNQADEEVYQLT
ncbi:MAG: FdtA/QdtA family cupin domain-containing protein [Candidatus Shapirobacteria bacterium]|nr:FdtA/QdtA family cupin domain-containing protein [Candidatus Shapirobacteria bacterium]